MQESSKILLSKKELEVLGEVEFFQLKKSITTKIYSQLAALVQQLRAEASFSKIPFPAGTDVTTGKISKGENYLGLPFILLDFPRRFTEENIFAYRTMVWWGNFISASLLLSGPVSVVARKNVLRQLRSLKGKDIFVCIHESPWHHHFHMENYIPLDILNKKEVEEALNEQSFLKLARKIPIRQIKKLQEFSLESFRIFSRLLTDSE